MKLKILFRFCQVDSKKNRFSTLSLRDSILAESTFIIALTTTSLRETHGVSWQFIMWILADRAIFARIPFVLKI